MSKLWSEDFTGQNLASAYLAYLGLPELRHNSSLEYAQTVVSKCGRRCSIFRIANGWRYSIALGAFALDYSSGVFYSRFNH